jgi:hypothetical protein
MRLDIEFLERVLLRLVPPSVVSKTIHIELDLICTNSGIAKKTTGSIIAVVIIIFHLVYLIICPNLFLHR